MSYRKKSGMQEINKAQSYCAYSARASLSRTRFVGVIFTHIDIMIRYILIVAVLFGISACASTPLVLNSCYLTVVDEENDSYAQLCFSEPPDKRGEILFYTRNTLLNNQGKRAAVCRQKFDSVTEGDKIYLKPKIARCGLKNAKKPPVSGRAITGVSFRSEIDYCWFDEKKSLLCKEQGSKKQYEFQRVRLK